MVNILVVDDSAFMRKSLSMMLESDPGIKVIGVARDGIEAIEKIKSLKPDLVTLDIEMPRMDGLTALGIIMKEMPVPVVMVSSLTSEGAQATLEALSLGAVDFIPKEMSFVSLDIVKIKEELVSKVKQIAASRAVRARIQARRLPVQMHGRSPGSPANAGLAARKSLISMKKPPSGFGALVVGISTGGPFALLQLIPQLPPDFPLGVAIVQHMPPRFTKSMAERLNTLSQLEVREAEEGDMLKPGVVLIAPGGQHLQFTRNGLGMRARITADPTTTLYRPSADIMMSSAAEVFEQPLLGLIMTGMGKDGLEGLKLIKRKNGYVVAQDEESCVVYGMPKAAVDAGVADAVVSLEQIPNALVHLTMR